MALAQMQTNPLNEEELIPIRLASMLDYRGTDMVIRSFPELEALSEEERNAIGFYTIVEDPRPAAGRTMLSDSYAFEGGQVVQYAVYEEVPLDHTRQFRLQELSARRKAAQKEFNFAGMSIMLDKDTEDAIDKARNWLQLKPEGTIIMYQIKPGVSTALDLPWMTAIGEAAGDRVQACFANSAVLEAQIMEAETLEDLLALDLSTGWPE